MNRPLDRRGHSLSFVDGNVILFGGISQTCLCTNETSDSTCPNRYAYSNDVWSFNQFTTKWTLFHEHSSNVLKPQGREHHSATVLNNGKILVIGGLSSKSTNFHVNDRSTILGDVWEMTLDEISSHIIQGYSEYTLPQTFVDGRVFYHTQHPQLFGENNIDEGELCVHDIEVMVSLSHECIEQIGHLTLFGPNLGDNIGSLWGDNQGIKLFQGRHTPSTCTSTTVNLTFSDEAEMSIVDFDFLPVKSESLQPTDSLLNQFTNTKVNGNWTLSIYDKLSDGITGKLIDWKLKVDVKQCTEGAHWKRLSANNCGDNDFASKHNTCKIDFSMAENGVEFDSFTPRYLHTAIAVDNDVFILGGFNGEVLDDAWKFHYHSKSWIQLQVAAEGTNHNFKSTVLSPWGLFSFGRENKSIGYDTIYHYDITLDVWSEHEIKPRFTSQKIEVRRFYPICYIGSHKNVPKQRVKIAWSDLIVEPSIMLFGGDTDLPKQSYLGDMWILSLQKFVVANQETAYARHSSFCKWRLKNSKSWNNSCGILNHNASHSICYLNEIILMAWCKKQYQNFLL